MQKREISHLEARIKEMREDLTSLADGAPFQEFLKIIHHPGFTTPAEILLFTGIVDSMRAQAGALLALKRAMVSAAAKVEINPQPLPP